MRVFLLLGASVALSGCSTLGVGSMSELRYKLFPDGPAEFSLAHQESAAKDLTRNISTVPRDKSLAFIENKSSSYQPAMDALQLRGYSVLLVDDSSDVSSGDLPVAYNLDSVSDESQMAIADMRISNGLRVTRVYNDTGAAFVPASPVTMIKGEWDE